MGISVIGRATGGGGGGLPKEKSFGTSETWVVPDGVTSVEATIVGASAGGASSTSAQWRVTGAGGYWKGRLDVTPGESMAVTIGAGGGASNTAHYGGYTEFGAIRCTGSFSGDVGATGSVIQVSGEEPLVGMSTTRAIDLENQEFNNATTNARMVYSGDYYLWTGTVGNNSNSSMRMFNAKTGIYFVARQPTEVSSYDNGCQIFYWPEIDADYVYLYNWNSSSGSKFWTAFAVADLDAATSGSTVVGIDATTLSHFNAPSGTTNISYIATHDIIDGTLYFGSRGQGSLWSTTDLTTWTETTYLDLGWSNNSFMPCGIQKDSSGGLWLVGSYTYNNTTSRMISYSADGGSTWSSAQFNTSVEIIGAGTYYYPQYQPGTLWRIVHEENGYIWTMSAGLRANASMSPYSGWAQVDSWYLSGTTINRQSSQWSYLNFATGGSDNSRNVGEYGVLDMYKEGSSYYWRAGTQTVASTLSFSPQFTSTGGVTWGYSIDTQIVKNDTSTSGQTLVFARGRWLFANAWDNDYTKVKVWNLFFGQPPIPVHYTGQYYASSGAYGIGYGGVSSSYGKIQAYPGPPAADGFAGGLVWDGGYMYPSEKIARPGWGGAYQEKGNDGILVLRWTE